MGEGLEPLHTDTYCLFWSQPQIPSRESLFEQSKIVDDIHLINHCGVRRYSAQGRATEETYKWSYVSLSLFHTSTFSINSGKSP